MYLSKDIRQQLFLCIIHRYNFLRIGLVCIYRYCIYSKHLFTGSSTFAHFKFVMGSAILYFHQPTEEQSGGTLSSYSEPAGQ